MNQRMHRGLIVLYSAVTLINAVWFLVWPSFDHFNLTLLCGALIMYQLTVMRWQQATQMWRRASENWERMYNGERPDFDGYEKWLKGDWR